MEEFYYDKHPNLIGPIMKTTVCTIVKKPQINNTISDKISSYVSEIYNNYIVDNKIIIFIIVTFVIFLIYRYYNKTPKEEKKEEKKEEFTNEEYNLLKEIEEYQTKHLLYDNPPSMNPLISPSDQEDDVFYPPDPLPIRLPPTQDIVYSRNIYENPPPFQQLNNVNYDYNNVYTNPSRAYNTGTYNTYQNAQNTNITNPYNWSNNFNTNTGNFVGPMTTMNMESLNQYQGIQDNTTQNLLDAMKFGPMYANGSIDPPYANDF